MKKGLFITLEGPDGCGKTTQTKLLVDFLQSRGYPVLHTREPGGTSFAENLRSILLNPRFKISPLAELMLYEASRAQHTDEVVRPALKQGKIVLCERYTDATVAYQGYGRKLDLSTIKKLNAIATDGLLPDLTLVLDIPAKEGLKRAKNLNKKDRLENEGVAFHNRVRKGYFALAKQEPRRIKVISALDSIESVHDELIAELMKIIERKK